MKKHQKPIPAVVHTEMSSKGRTTSVFFEILLLYLGMLGYIFCNVTALGLKDFWLPAVLIATLPFAAMIFIVWYKRVFFAVLGGIAGISLLAFPITFPLYGMLARSIEIFYNYIIHLLTLQKGYEHYESYMSMDLTSVLKDPLELSSSLYAALIVLALIAAVFFALALFRRVPIMVAFIVPALTLIPFFYYGIVPHYAALALFLSALIGCYGQSVTQHLERSRRRKERRLLKATEEKKTKKAKKEKKAKKPRRFLNAEQRLSFAAGHGSFGITVTAVMLLITLSVAGLIYSRPILQLDQVRIAIDRAAQQSTNALFRHNFEERLKVAGYIEDGEYLSMDVPKWRGLKVSEVVTNTENPIYLRYRTMLDLNKEGWSLPDEEYQETLESEVGIDFCEYTQYYEFLKLTAASGDPLEAGLDSSESEEEGYYSDQVTVKPFYKASNYLGLPAGCTSVSPLSDYEELIRSGDTLLYHKKNAGNKIYGYTVSAPYLNNKTFQTNFTSVQQQYLQMRGQHSSNNLYLNQEQSYSLFAFRNNTELPAEVTQMVLPLAQEITAPYTEKFERVQALERYFRSEYKYSDARQRLMLQDGTVADSFDQLYYFLYENKKKEGYCTLFASAMTAMVRSLGYPARVVTGYYVEPEYLGDDRYGAPIYDKDYHAWVEVYFDGAGWLRFDPTPGFDGMRNYYLLKMIDENKLDEIRPNVKVEYYQYGYIEYPKELPDPTYEEEEWDPFKQLTDEELRLKMLIRILLIALQVLIVIALLAGLLLINRLQYRSALKKLRSLPPGKAVERGYYYILRLMQLRRFKFFEGELLEDFAVRADNLRLAELPLRPIIPILQKRLYSELEISEEERAAVADYVEALNKAAFRRRNPLRAFWYRLTFRKKPDYKKMIWKFK